MKFFSYDSKFTQLMLKLCYACYLNLLWFVCSLPIVTIGASTTALYYVCFKIVRDEEHHVGRLFFRAFRENFRQATQLWLIMLGMGIFLGADMYIVWHLRASAVGAAAVLWTLLLAFLIAVSVMYVIVLTYLFPLLASVENTNRAMLKNSFLIGTRYLFVTIVVFAIHVIMFLAIVIVFTPLVIFGEGLAALISSFFLLNVIRLCSYLPEEENEK